MKDKIIARLKAKFPGINFSKARLDAIADKLKVTEESEIDGKLDELNEVFPFADIAKQDDRIRGLDAKDKDKDKNKDQPQPNSPQPVNEPATDDDVPKWAKTLIDQNKTLAEKVLAIETGKTIDTRKSRLEETLKGASDAFKKTTLKAFDRATFKDDADFDAYLEDIKTDAAEFVQDEANQGLGQQKKPIVPTGGGGKNPVQATAEEAANVLKNM